MKTIIDFRGNTQILSDERYEIIKTPDILRAGMHYEVGTIVRLISGVDNSKIPGYHFYKNFVTICREDATLAEFVGFEKSFLKRIK